LLDSLLQEATTRQILHEVQSAELFPMARSWRTVKLKKVKVLVKKIQLECKPVEVRVSRRNLKVKSVCVKLQRLIVKVRNVNVNLKSVVVEEYVKNRNLVRILNDETSPNIVDCLLMGKGTMSPIYSRKPTIIPPYVSYELGSQKSIEEDDEENPRKRVPDWAQESSVMRAVLNRVDPDLVFETCEPPDLVDMFPCPATSYTRRDIWNSPVQSNIIDSTYVVNDDMVVVEESLVAEDRLNELHDETYVVSENYQKGEITFALDNRKETTATENKDFNNESSIDEEDDEEVRFDLPNRKTVNYHF